MDPHPIERAQAELYDEVPMDATVVQAVAQVLGIDAGDVIEHLIVRQMTEADRHVDRYVPAMRNVRRAAVGCGFVAGVTFAAAVRRVQDGEP